MGQRALGLVERRLVGPGVDHHDGFALPHLLAFCELDRKQLAVDARLDGDAVIRGNSAQAGEIDGHRLLFGRDNLHRDRAPQQSRSLVGSVGRGLLLVLIDTPDNETHRGSQNEIDDNPDPGVLTAGGLRFAGFGQISLSGVLNWHVLISRQSSLNRDKLPATLTP